MNNIFIIEDHDEALKLWRENNVRDLDLIHIDAHIDFGFQLAKLPEKIIKEADDNWFLNPGLKDITSSDLERRVYAALYLGASGDPRAVEPIVTTLEKETHQGGKWREIYTLGELGINHPRAVAILNKIATSDEDEVIRKAAGEALKKIELPK